MGMLYEFSFIVCCFEVAMTLEKRRNLIRIAKISSFLEKQLPKRERVSFLNSHLTFH